jgi:putative ABC transport system permease protein
MRDSFKLSARMLARDWRAGELKALAAALLVATASVTTVAFFSDRVARALTQNASVLLGADLRLSGDRPLPGEFRQQADRMRLSTTSTLKFPSMVVNGDSGVLSEIQAVEEGYPLRGEIKGAPASPPIAKSIPSRGEVWPDTKLAARLNLARGDSVALGSSSFKVSAIIREEPESAVGFFNLGPRLLMNLDDVAQTGLVQTGSRVRHSLLVAGEQDEIVAFRRFAEAKITRGQQLQDVRSARPEIKSALERAEKFLGLAALSSVMLAAAAIALAARRYVQRHLDACAMMRCVGASQPLIVRLYLEQFALFGILASGAGCVIGALAQQALALLLAPLVGSALPAPGITPAVSGFAAGFLLLIGFALPPVLALQQVPALRVLRRELGVRTGAAGYAFGIVLVIIALLWQANDMRLGAYILGGVAGIIFVSAAIASLFFKLAKKMNNSGLSWRYGLISLRRRKLGTVVQVAALGLGLMALLTLTVVRDDLLRNWKSTLPPDTPNRFLVSVQPEQIEPLTEFFARNGLAAPRFFPMVRGRLVAINERVVSSENYPDERAKRLVDREFNLSWAGELQPDNVIVVGRWLAGTPSLSVEQGIAETLGVRLGDRLTYDIAGSQMSAQVTSLRKVDWDSFRVNFFVIAEPGLLEDFPASYVTSFYLSAQESGLMGRLLREFSNILVIDVEAILSSVQEMMRQVRHAVQFVFLFTLLAGLTVLYSAITLTAEERNREAALLRTLGAGTRELQVSLAAEFAVLGTLAGIVGAVGATVLTYVLATEVFNLPFAVNHWVWIAGVAGGALVVAVAGLLGTRAVLKSPPWTALRAAE